MTGHVRFAHQLRPARDTDVGVLVDRARTAERIGFDAVCVPDHVGPGSLAPLPTLAAIAALTERVRLGTYVLNSAMRNTVQLAWEAVTLDHVSGGRFELGLGAGHTPHEFEATGIDRRPARERKAVLISQVEVLRRLFDGERVSAELDGIQLTDAEVGRPVQECLPMLVGGNGEALLTHAGRHADLVGLQGLGRTLEDGHRHEVRWDAEHLERQLGQVRAGAAGRDLPPVIDVLVQIVDVTDDAERSIAALCEEVPGLQPEQLVETPYVLIGTIDEIVAKVRRSVDRWGIGSFTVRALDEFAPVVAACR